jgi:hypothetical protein
MTISTHGIAFADPKHCDRSGWPSCYDVGFDGGRANPGTSCPSGHSANYCRGWEAASGGSFRDGSNDNSGSSNDNSGSSSGLVTKVCNALSTKNVAALGALLSLLHVSTAGTSAEILAAAEALCALR